MKNHEHKKKLTGIFSALLFSILICHTAQAMNETENNDTAAKADTFSIGDTINGSIKDEEDIDIFKCTLSQSGKLKLTATSYMKYYIIELLDASGDRLWISGSYNRWNELLGFRTDIYELDLEKGSYYIKISGKASQFDSSNFSTGSYRMQTSFQTSGANIAEPNNSYQEAKSITVGQQVKGQIALNDPYDIYKITIYDPVKIQITSYMECYTLEILDYYDTWAQIVWDTDYNYWDANMQKRTDTFYPKLPKGIYYIRITGTKSHGYNNDYTGNYTFKVSKTAQTLTLNKKKIKLNKKQSIQLKASISPVNTGEAVRYSVGDTSIASVSAKGMVTAKKMGHTTLTATVGDVTARCEIFVLPPKTKIVKLWSTKEKGFWGTCRYIHVKCKRVKNVDYQVYYSKKKNGKYKELYTSSASNNYCSVKRKGRYYVKVRTKIYSDDCYVYSSWSSPKSVTVK